MGAEPEIDCWAMGDTDVHDVPIAKGSKIILYLGSANRDDYTISGSTPIAISTERCFALPISYRSSSTPEPGPGRRTPTKSIG